MELDFLLGISFKDWISLLYENNFSIDRKYCSRALLLTLLSIRNSYLRRKEEKLYKEIIEKTEVFSPLFIIGHWRSGTTLVHNLMALDKHYAFPNLFQVTHPHSFITLEKTVEAAFASSQSYCRPMDNMLVTYKSPGEDESAVAVLSGRSPIIGWGFTENTDFYNRFHTFTVASPEELERWKSAFIWFLKKLTWRYKLPLVLKSPIHTGRIRLLLELFPNAKFIHIYRNPISVFQSTFNLYQKLVPNMCLQKIDQNKWIDDIIQNYKVMYESYFLEKMLIPDGHLIEVRYEDFVSGMPKYMQHIYECLNIGDFSMVQRDIEDYVKLQKEYKKNEFPGLPGNLHQRILSEWSLSFDEWGYSNNAIFKQN